MTTTTRTVLAGAIGNVLEWYDFGLYGLLAPVLASVFFPEQNRFAALVGVYGGFALGFVVRPLGAVVLGRVGDRQGRHFVLVLSVALMGAATVAVGLLPTYAAVGVAAPVLLIAVRLLQGFSVGGEFVGSVTYLVETAPQNRRGLAGSVANLGATVGMLLAAGVAAMTLGYARPHPALWRLPFLLGGVLAAGGYLLRRHLPEGPAPAPERPLAIPGPKARSKAATAEPGRWPALDAFRRFPRLMLVTLLFTLGYGVSNYLVMVFLPTFGREFAGIPVGVALEINTAGQALALGLVPLAGWISDRWLRRRTLLALAFFLQAGLALSLFRHVLLAGAAGLWTAQLVLAGLLALVMGAAPAMLAEQFPCGYRVSAHAIALNAGVGVGGGTAPMVALLLIRISGSALAAPAYLAAACAAAAVAALGLKDRSRELLDQSLAQPQWERH